MIARFAERLSEATPERPSARCLSKAALRRIVLDIRDRLNVDGLRSVSGEALIEHLRRAGVVSPVSVDIVDGVRRRVAPYVVGLDSAFAAPEPIELLTAIEPHGVICFFSALQLYDLTTQLPSHHNIAKLTEPQSPRNSARVAPETSLHSKGRRQRNPLGEFVFSFNDVPYYFNRRCISIVPGVVQRYFGNKTLYRVTTLEQTLIDTLQSPRSCGGPAVVFEAWERSVSRINSKRLLDYLLVLKSDVISRRVFSMIELIGQGLPSVMVSFRSALAQRVASENPPPIPLLAGMNYRALDSTWLTMRP